MPGLAMNPGGIQGDSTVKEEDDALQEFDEEGDDDPEYRSREKLREPQKYLRSVKHMFDRIERGQLDLDPEYQRQVVWTANGMMKLINSLMENYYIPPIILNKVQRPDGMQISVCVDGKQRLSSIRAFMKGMIPCTDHRGARWWYINTSTQPRNVLPEHARREFEEMEFMCFEYSELTTAQEEDLFARVQLGIPLTAAEKMRAMSGPWQELAKAFVNDFPRVFEINSQKDQSPATKFQLVMGCLTQIMEVRDPSTADGTPCIKCSTAGVKRFLECKPDLDEDTRSHLGAVFRKLDHLVELDEEVFRNTKRLFQSTRSFLNVEYVAATVLISEYMEDRDDDVLLGDIRGIREYLHENLAKEEHRVTIQTWKVVWNYIDNLERYRGATNGTTIQTRKAQSSATGLPYTQPVLSGAVSTEWPVRNAPPTPRATPGSEPHPSADSVERAQLGPPPPVKESVKRKAPSRALNDAAEQSKRSRAAEDVKIPVVHQPQPLPPTPCSDPGGFVAVNSMAPPLGSQLAMAANPSSTNIAPPYLPPPTRRGGLQTARRSKMPNPGVSVSRRSRSASSQQGLQTQTDPAAAVGQSSVSPSMGLLTPVTPILSLQTQTQPRQPVGPHSKEYQRMTNVVRAAQADNLIDLTDDAPPAKSQPMQTAPKTENPTGMMEPPQLTIRPLQPLQQFKRTARRGRSGTAPHNNPESAKPNIHY